MNSYETLSKLELDLLKFEKHIITSANITYKLYIKTTSPAEQIFKNTKDIQKYLNIDTKFNKKFELPNRLHQNTKEIFEKYLSSLQSEQKIPQNYNSLQTIDYIKQKIEEIRLKKIKISA